MSAGTIGVQVTGPYQGAVTVAAGTKSGEQLITSGQDWQSLGFVNGDTLTLSNVAGTESGNCESSAFNVQVGFDATFTQATCVIDNIVGTSLYVSDITALYPTYTRYYDEMLNTDIAVISPHDYNTTSISLTNQIDANAGLSDNNNSSAAAADVLASSMTLSAVNSLIVPTTGVPYEGSVTINAAPAANQPYAGDVYLTGPNWGTYFYAIGQQVQFSDAGATS